MPKPEDQRSHFRHPIQMHKQISVRLSQDDNLRVEGSSRRDQLVGWIVNLSLGGMLVRLEDPALRLAVGERFVASFQLWTGERVTVQTEIRHALPVADVVCHGMSFLYEKGSSRDEQERTLWQFLTSEQRTQKKVQLDQRRKTRQQLSRLVGQLYSVKKAHAAVARASSLVLPLTLATLLGLGGAAGVFLFLHGANQSRWDDLLDKHGVTEKFGRASPDFEALARNVLASQQLPFVSYADREQEKARLEKEYARLMKDVSAEYERARVSPAVLAVSVAGTGLALFGLVSVAATLLRPYRLSRARRWREGQIGLVLRSFPEQVNSSGGRQVLEDATRLENLIRSQEELIYSLQRQ